MKRKVIYFTSTTHSERSTVNTRRLFPGQNLHTCQSTVILSSNRQEGTAEAASSVSADDDAHVETGVPFVDTGYGQSARERAVAVRRRVDHVTSRVAWVLLLLLLRRRWRHQNGVLVAGVVHNCRIATTSLIALIFDAL